MKTLSTKLFAAIAILIVILATNSSAVAQKFKPGDRVECDPSGVNDWMQGTVVAYLEKDNPIFNGEYYVIRVKIDKWTLNPEGVLCQTERVRLSKQTPAKPSQNENQKEETEETGNQPGETKTAENQTDAKYKPGDRVECDKAGIGSFQKGTILPYEKNDADPGDPPYFYRVRIDDYAGISPKGLLCFTKNIRRLTGAAAQPPPRDPVVGEVTEDEDSTLSADRPILQCPIKQPPARNGQRPNEELLKKIIRCSQGEKPAPKGSEGAITIDISALQIGTPRKWSYNQDIGDGKLGTIVYPVKVTFTRKVFYRTQTYVWANRIRIFNFYVNAFGEWRYGSEEGVKEAEYRAVPRYR